MEILSTVHVSRSFPAAEIDRRIRETIAEQKARQGALLLSTRSACDPEIDSLAVVEIIIAIEEILGVTLPPSFEPRGGYTDVEACVSGLTAEIREACKGRFREEQENEGSASRTGEPVGA